MANDARDRPFILQWRSAVLNSSLPASSKLCLLTLAEFANKDGTSCWPAIELIARKASVNEKTVRRVMDQAEPEGWIRRAHRGSKRGWRLFAYTLLVPHGADTMPARQAEGVDTESARQPESSGHPVHDVRTLSPHGAGTVSTDLGITHPVPREEQPAPPQAAVRKSSKKGCTYQEWLAAKADDEQCISADHHVFRYADRVGIPEGFLYLAWQVFRERYRRDQKARYIDWPSHFRKAVEGNWYGLWWIDAESNYQLTTKGKQARAFHGDDDE